MQIGDLVRYPADGDIGIVVEVGSLIVCIWADGGKGYHLESTLELIDESR